MPYVFSNRQSPSGMSYLRVDASGTIELSDGQALLAALCNLDDPVRAMCVIAKGTNYTPEVRKFFPSLSGNYGAIAAVGVGPIARASITLMMRMKEKRDPNDPELASVRMFSDERVAIAWLERQYAGERTRQSA
ncbi:hypothetical protein G6O69_25585 [Pseudenhygromyxa sp. WMMC2535]|uniref:hypothetical protein n=1 Tax=Pseudenhygromyxa sp. WMMC2535 TaxID=2712867 RepID=UPI0015534F56|nr:hypothetical protein [Pseudenhygromyxa sp. WMMC2535]NVB41237.1 hypothetical protein [Pseudenhygromyxa sp. WMMC2535]